MLTFIRNKVVHGALTNWHDWIFLLIKLNDDYEGASYKYSVEVHLEVMQNLDFQHVSWPDVIAACYVLVERSARLELDGYDYVVWHVALEACASSTL